MNQVYRVVWSERSGSWVAVSEISAARGKRCGRTTDRRAGLLAAGRTALAITATAGVFSSGAAIASGIDGGLANESDTSIAIGKGSIGYDTSAVAIGNNAIADTTVGDWTSSKNAPVAIGYSALGRGLGAVALGAGANVGTTDAWGQGDGFHSQIDYGTAIGNDARVRGQFGTALGARATADGASSVSAGTDSRATGYRALALGARSAAAADNAIALGTDSNSIVNSGVAIGTAAQATAANSVALGASSVAKRQDSVSVGTDTYKRQIVNVKAGTQETDAVNVGQLNEVSVMASQQNRYFKAAGASDGTDDAAASGTRAMALGAGAKASAINSVALGAGALADRDNAVSVGSTTQARQVVNVASGTQRTDAVNVGQMEDAIKTVTGGSSASISNAVMYDDTASHGDVTLKRNGGGTVAVHNVAAAKADTDAVNFGQLKDAGLHTDANGNVVGGFIAYDGSDKSRITLEGGAQGTTIANLRAGKADSEAVNVGQLKAAGVLGVDPVTGDQTGLAVSYENGYKDAVRLGGKTGTSIRNVAAGKAPDEAVNVGQLQEAGIINKNGNVMKPVVFNGAAGEANAENRKMINLADGRADSDAVNLKQMKDAIASATGSGTVSSTLDFLKVNSATGSGPATAAGTDGVSIGKAARVTDASENGVAIGANASADAKNSVALGAGSATDGRQNVVSVGSVGIAPAGVVATPNDRQIIHVAAGTRDADAVNVSQLGGVVAALGGNASIDSTGKIVKPSYIVKDASGNSTTFSDVGSAIGAVNDTVNSVAPNLKYMKFGPSTAAQGQASGTDAVALGGNAFATMDRAIALGRNARASNIDTLALGYGSNASQAGAVAIGQGASATQLNAIAIGMNSVANQANTVSLGSASNLRRLVNLQDGTDATDAVNLRQVNSLVSNALKTSGTQQPLRSAETYPGSTIQAETTSSLPPAQLIASGPTDKKDGVKATARDSLAAGMNSQATAEEALAMGTNVQSAQFGGVGVGSNVQVGGSYATAVGSVASAIGNKSVAIGHNTSADSDNGVAIGSDVAAKGMNSVVVGSNVVATGKNNVVLGAGSDGSMDNAVSVGDTGAERRIVHVARGVDAMDAVNVSQLKTAGFDINSSGVIANPAVTYNDATRSAVKLGGKDATTPVKLSNVAQGGSGTDAVNVDQLNTALANGGGGGPLAVKYDDAAHSAVTFNKGGAATALANVAAAKADDQAVNLKQLKDAGLSIDPNTGGATNSFVAYDDGSRGKVTLNKGGAAATLANVAAAKADDQAVNLKQLKDAGLTVDATTGGVTNAVVAYDDSTKGRVTFNKNGSSPTVLAHVAAGKANDEAVNVRQLKDAGLNIDPTTGSATNSFVAYDDSSKGKVTLNKGGAATTLANVAAAKADDQAVNLKQLKDAGLTINPANGTISNGFVAYDDGTKGRVTFNRNGSGPTVLAHVAAGKSDDEAVNVRQLKDAGLNIDPNTGGATNSFVAYDDGSRSKVTLNRGGVAATLTNVASGVSDVDAVNMKQLKSGVASVASALGGGAGEDGKGGMTAPTYRINDANGEAHEYRTVGDALNAVTGSMQGIAPNLKYIKFGVSTAAQAQASGTDSIAIGGNAFATNDRALSIGRNARASGVDTVALGVGAAASQFNTVAIGAGATVTQAGSVAIGYNSVANQANTFSVGNSSNLRRVVNVAEGTNATDAVNLAQMNKLLAGSRVAAEPMLPRASVQAAGKSSLAPEALIASGPTDKGGQLEAQGRDAIAIGLNNRADGVGSVAVGSTVMNGADGAVGVGSNVMIDGTNSVAIGSNVSTGANGAIAIGVGSAADGANAILIGNQSQVRKGADNSVAIGNNITSATGKNNIVLGTNSDGVLDNVLSIGAAGQERRIVNVAAGSGNTDAVNVSQLAGVAKAMGGGAAVNADGSIAGPQYKIGGQTYSDVGTALAAAATGGGAGGSGIDAMAVHYDDAAYGAVTLNKGGTAVTLSNVATAKADTDAVNLKQLKDAGLTVNSATGGVTNSFVAYDDSSKGKVTFNKGGSQTVLSNIAAGAGDTDAVNLKQMNDAIKSAAATGGDPLGVAYDDASKASMTLGGQGGTRIANVAAGVNDLDAVNVRQLRDAGLISAQGGTLAVTYADASKQVVNFGNLGRVATLNNVADGQLAAGSKQAVNGGQLFALTQRVDNLGKEVSQFPAGAGGEANPMFAAAGNKLTEKAVASGERAVATGAGAQATGTNATAAGAKAVASGSGTTALGANASATADNAVAIGANAVADRANSVSFGAPGQERALTNVADVDTTQASNAKVAVNAGTMNSAIAHSAAETLQSANQYTDQAMGQLGGRINDVDRSAIRGIAAASALNNVTPYLPGRTSINAGVAAYRGTPAVGVTVSRWNQRGNINLNGGVSTAGGNSTIVRVGVGVVF